MRLGSSTAVTRADHHTDLSHDDKRLSLVLKRCPRCGRDRFLSLLRIVCMDCSDKAAKDGRE